MLNYSQLLGKGITGKVLSGKGQSITNSMSAYYPLITSLVPLYSDKVMQFQRASVATTTDFEEVLIEVKAGECRFAGSRRVENLANATAIYASETIPVEFGTDYIFSMEGLGFVTFSGAATGTLLGDTGRVEIGLTALSTALTITVSGEITKAQLEKKIGTQEKASEYISKGDAGAVYPFHGCGVDGVKYFETDRSNNRLLAWPTGTMKLATNEPDGENLFLNSKAPVTQTVTVISGTDYTVSLKGEGQIDLTGAAEGIVTQDKPVIFSAANTSLVCTLSGDIEICQVAPEAFPSSFIVTAGTPGFRSADSFQADNTSGDIMGNSFCFIANYIPLPSGGNLKDGELNLFATDDAITEPGATYEYVVTGGDGSFHLIKDDINGIAINRFALQVFQDDDGVTVNATIYKDGKKEYQGNQAQVLSHISDSIEFGSQDGTVFPCHLGNIRIFHTELTDTQLNLLTWSGYLQDEFYDFITTEDDELIFAE